jgi:glycosyltransferase involved in cell wall biosynthesis
MAVFYIAEQSAVSVSGHYYAYTQCVARGARAAGFDVVILENTRFHDDWKVEGVTGVPAFSKTWGEAEQIFFHLWAPGNIAYEFVEATRSNPPRAGDHVLFHTLGFAELRCILDYLIDLPVSDDLPFIHVLLRYDPALIRISIDLFGQLFDKVNAAAHLRRKVIFHTDTDLLSAEYTRLTGTPFNTLPIPFQQKRLRERLAAPTPRKPGSPLVVTYLGDARLEKGYRDFPAALEFLKPQLTSGKVRFRLQSNFNSAGGETGIMAAVQKLGQYPASQVELMMNPLDHNAYYDHLVDADAVLIPYDPDRYRARSSGVLIEAMSAGKPVITTRGSWMETQVTAENAVLCDDSAKLGPALLELIQNFSRYDAGAKAKAASALNASTGDHFVAELLKSTQLTNLPQRSDKAPRVLVIMNGDAVIQQNGAGQVVRSQLEYLKRAGYKVAGLFMANDPDVGPKAMEAWTRLLLRQLVPHDLEAVFIAAPGRLSTDVLRQQAGRDRYESSIRNEVEKVAAYDVHLGLVEYLRSHPVDVTLLNYITSYPLVERLGLNKGPVICEMLDIQSFQKAIYGHRPVTQADLDAEFALLARCQQLISLNASETQFVLERLPDMSIVTTGIFPSVEAATLDALAGVTSLAELVASTQPLRAEYQAAALRRRRETDGAAGQDGHRPAVRQLQPPGQCRRPALVHRERLPAQSRAAGREHGGGRFDR